MDDARVGAAGGMIFSSTAAGLHDAHREIGRGPVATWPRSGRWGVPIIQLLQLDHVLSRGFGIAGAGTVITPGSDHDAVWAQLVPQRR